MSQPVDPPPVTIPAPGPVRAAAASIGLQALGIVAFGVSVVLSATGDGTSLGPALAQGAYFAVLAAGIAAVAVGLVRGRRWSRTPGIVIEIIVVAIGFWLAFPSDRLGAGLALVLLGGLTGYLLVSPPANLWIAQFPPLFGPDPDH